MIENPYGFDYFETTVVDEIPQYALVIHTGIKIQGDTFQMRSLLIVDEGEPVPDKLILISEAKGTVRPNTSRADIMREAAIVVSSIHAQALDRLEQMSDELFMIVSALVGNAAPVAATQPPAAVVRNYGRSQICLN